MSLKRARAGEEEAHTVATERQFLQDQDAFIQSCVRLETGVRVHPAPAEEGRAYTDVVLLVADTTPQTAAEIVAALRAQSEQPHGAPVVRRLLSSPTAEAALQDVVRAAVAGGAGGKATGTASSRLALSWESPAPPPHPPHAQPYVQVTAVVLPSLASRANCPYRPDAAVGPLREAAKAARANSKLYAEEAAGAKEGEPHPPARTVLEVVGLAPTAAALPLTVAVARAMPHRFTAKGGSGHRGAYTDPSAAPPSFVAHLHLAHPVPEVHARKLETVARSVQLTQRLIDAPPSVLNTVSYAAVVAGLAARHGCRSEVIKGEALKEQGYGGIYAVGRGAEYPPHLITLFYGDAERRQKNIKPSGDAKAKRNIAFVGKGIVYDCGGLALKPAASMANMKTDMGGSAAVLGAFLALVEMEALTHAQGATVGELSCTLCVAENAIGSRAYHNDDILLLKSGKSIEVMNTDAEGRLVLADGVYHATGELPFAPDVLIDMATLTGAQGVACGLKHAGLYSNSADAEAALLAAGRHSGDTCWPVLYCPEYHGPNYSSPCADLRNINSGKPDASVSLGGYFVEANLAPRFAGSLLHVDLAFPSFDSVGATGFGVALAVAYVEKDL